MTSSILFVFFCLLNIYSFSRFFALFRQNIIFFWTEEFERTIDAPNESNNRVDFGAIIVDFANANSPDEKIGRLEFRILWQKYMYIYMYRYVQREGKEIDNNRTIGVVDFRTRAKMFPRSANCHVTKYRRFLYSIFVNYFLFFLFIFLVALHSAYFRVCDLVP